MKLRIQQGITHGSRRNKKYTKIFAPHVIIINVVILSSSGTTLKRDEVYCSKGSLDEESISEEISKEGERVQGKVFGEILRNAKCSCWLVGSN